MSAINLPGSRETTASTEQKSTHRMRRIGTLFDAKQAVRIVTAYQSQAFAHYAFWRYAKWRKTRIFRK